MSLVNIKNSTETFASIDTPTGSVKLDTKDKYVDDFITIEADIPETPLNPLTVTSLGTFNPPSGTGYGTVTVQDSDCVAGNIKSGVNIFGVTGSYTAPTKNVQVYTTPVSITSTSMSATNMKITVSKAGTYTIYAAVGCNRNTGTYQYAIYKNSTAIVSATNISTTTGTCKVLTNQTLAVGDVITLYLKSASTSYRATGQFLGIVEQ